MDYGKAALIVVVTLILVVAINAAIYYSLAKGNEARQIDLLRKAANRARDPWKVENDALRELSQRVAELKEKDGKTGEEVE